MKRLPKWETLLANAVRRFAPLPFVWGANDCCLLAANIIKEITGEDIARKYRGYKTSAEAIFALRRNGHRGVSDALAEAGELFGMPEIEPQYSGRGDLCLLPFGDLGGTAGICLGTEIIAPGDSAAVFVPASTVIRAWRTRTDA